MKGGSTNFFPTPKGLGSRIENERTKNICEDSDNKYPKKKLPGLIQPITEETSAHIPIERKISAKP